MFKNAITFKFPATVMTAERLSEAFAQEPFTECGPTDTMQCGWLPARGQDFGDLCESIGGELIARFAVEVKTVPASAIKKQAREMADSIEQQTGRVVGRREMKDLKEEALQMLLPQAFPRRSVHMVWIDRLRNRLVFDCASPKKADALISCMVDCGAWPEGTAPMCFESDFPATVASWLRDKETQPAAFNLGGSLVLEGAGDDTTKARFKDAQPLDSAEILAHLDKRMHPTAIELVGAGIAFTVKETLTFQKLVFENTEKGETPDDAADLFDGDVILETRLMRQAFDDLAAAMGGEYEPE